MKWMARKRLHARTGGFDMEPEVTATDLADWLDALEFRMTWRIVGLVVASNAVLAVAVGLLP